MEEQKVDSFKILNKRCGTPDPVLAELFLTAGVVFRCGECGSYDDIINFSKTEMNGMLPNEVYQCPKCQTAIKLVCSETGDVSHEKTITRM